MDVSNSEIASHLEEVAKHYQNREDKYRAIAYRKAAAIIKKHPTTITSGKEAMALKGIGKSIAETIDTYLKEGIVDRLQKIDLSEEDTLNLFQSVHGIGPVKAKNLYKAGFRTIESLSERPKEAKLTKAQILGLKWYKDINQPIPRAEIDQFHDYFSHVLEGLQWEITGSYRRGAEQSGDMDVLVRADGQTIDQIVSRIDLLVGDLASGPTKYMGIIQLKDGYPGRRIDIRLIDGESYPYALLYFTGSKTYNIMLRNKAIEKGWRLNEYTMFDQDGQKLPANSEKDIVTLLGLPYLPPNERN